MASVSTWRNDRNWTESITSELVSGGNLYLRAGTDIALLGGTQVYADGDAVLFAGRDIILAAQADTMRERGSSFGVSVTQGGGSTTVGVNASRNSASSTTYTPALLSVGGNLSLSSGQDTILRGAIVEADSASVNAGRNLTVETLQNLAQSRSASVGASVTFTGPHITGGSANVSGASSDRRFSDAVSGIFTNGALDITVGGVTELIGATVVSGQGLLNLDTGDLITRDLTDVDRSRSFSAGVTLEAPRPGGTSGGDSGTTTQDRPSALDYVSGLSGSYARSILEGRTLATIGQGSVTVRNQTDEQTSLQLAGLNRDASTNQIITRDESFRTGNLELDVGALRRARENLIRLQNPRAVANLQIEVEARLKGVEVSEEVEAEVANRLENLTDAEKTALSDVGYMLDSEEFRETVGLAIAAEMKRTGLSYDQIAGVLLHPTALRNLAVNSTKESDYDVGNIGNRLDSSSPFKCGCRPMVFRMRWSMAMRGKLIGACSWRLGTPVLKRLNGLQHFNLGKRTCWKAG